MPRITRQTEHVLAVLLREQSEPPYGLQIVDETGLSPGSVYPILRRLVKAGWVEKEWESPGPETENRAPRRYYSLTPEGERVAREALRETHAYLKSVGKVRLDGGKA